MPAILHVRMAGLELGDLCGRVVEFGLTTVALPQVSPFVR